MSGFSVDPEAVRAAGGDMVALSECVPFAKTHLESYAHVDVANGTVLALIGSRVNGIRERLVDDYSPGGRAHKPYHDCGEALKDTADDYEETDRSTAARVDGAMPDTEISREPEWITSAFPDVTLPDYQALLPEPENGFGAFNTYREVTAAITWVFGLDWLTMWLPTLGLVDPLAPLKEALDGDWDSVGKAVGSVSQVGDFWVAIARDTQNVPNRFKFVMVRGHPRPAPMSRPWSGNAADAANDYLIDLARHSSEHGHQLQDKSTAITLEVVALNDALTQLIGLIEDLMAVLPTGQSVEDFLKDLLSPHANLERMRRIAGLVTKMVNRVRIAIDCGFLVFAAVAELAAAGHVDYPQVDPYAAPDVDG